eukprot:2744888-Pyramimonas_sp.AAC.1
MEVSMCCTPMFFVRFPPWAPGTRRRNRGSNISLSRSNWSPPRVYPLVPPPIGLFLRLFLREHVLDPGYAAK